MPYVPVGNKETKKKKIYKFIINIYWKQIQDPTSDRLELLIENVC